MPRATLLPTPASSTDIKGQDGSKMASLQLAFELPPPAVTSEGGPSLPTSSAVLYPTQASETVKSRRRSSAANPPKDQFALPPPPTRSRKIIQMKPREEPSAEAPSSSSKAAGKGGGSSNSTAAASSTGATAGTKRKQPSATSAAGRKIARKTAHSLIERRRRSKMNEEFAVLKSLIPACTGEMHKLAILQASIEYVRYLEDCITKLKAQCGSEATTMTDPPPELRHTQSGLPSPALGPSYNPGGHSYPASSSSAGSASPDVEMTNSPSSGVPSPAFTPIAAGSRSQQPSVSPALIPEDAAAHNRHDSYSSVSSDYRLHGGSGGSYTTSATTSPFFGPLGGGGSGSHHLHHHQQRQQHYSQQHRSSQSHAQSPHLHEADASAASSQQHQHQHQHQQTHSALGSALTSPALPPQRDLDQEATAALLMLNQMDRRTSSGTIAPRGMSVRDLLSS